MTLDDRIHFAVLRITSGAGPTRPSDQTNPDIVLEDCRAEIMRLRAQRDELLAALEGLEQCFCWSDFARDWVLFGRERTYPALHTARAAIARAKGTP